MTRGVTLTYKNGANCGSKNRSMTLTFQCDAGARIFRDEPVDETATCEYSVFLKSTFGCPTRA